MDMVKFQELTIMWGLGFIVGSLMTISALLIYNYLKIRKEIKTLEKEKAIKITYKYDKKKEKSSLTNHNEGKILVKNLKGEDSH